MSNAFYRHIVAAAALALCCIAPVEARRVWPVVGTHPGDITKVAQCPPGKALVGLTGRAGVWIDEVQIICATPFGNGTFGPPSLGSDRYGGSGGAPMTRVCPRNSKLQNVKIDLTADSKRVGSIFLNCITPDGQQTRLNFRNDAQELPSSKGNAECGGKGMPSAVKAFTCNEIDVAYNHAPQQICPDEQFVGITVRFGQDVNAIGFICDSLAATGGDSVAPARRIKHTGRPL